MTVSSLVRRGLAAAALAAVPLAGLAAPAQAAAPSAEQAVPAAGQANGPQVHIFQYWGRGTVGSFNPVPAGRTLKFDIGFNLGGNRSDYTDLHYATSHPGTSLCAPLSSMNTGTAWPGQGQTCPVVLKAMKPGTSQKYWVTMTGKRAGKPFSVTASTLLYAPDVRTGIYLNGKRIDGTTQVIPASQKTVTIKYVVDNHSTATLSHVYATGLPGCSIKTVAPGTSGWCSWTADRAVIAWTTQRSGFDQMYDLTGGVGSVDTIIPVRNTYLVAR